MGVGCGVSCPELWGTVILGWKGEEGKALGPAEGPTSSLPQDLWNLIHRQAGEMEQEDAGYVCGGGWAADANVEKVDTRERSWAQGDGQFQWWGQGWSSQRLLLAGGPWMNRVGKGHPPGALEVCGYCVNRVSWASPLASAGPCAAILSLFSVEGR